MILGFSKLAGLVPVCVSRLNVILMKTLVSRPKHCTFYMEDDLGIDKIAVFNP